MLPYGRQSIDRSDVEAVVAALTQRLADHRPAGRRSSRRTSRRSPARPAVDGHQRHDRAAHGVRGGRRRARRRGRHHADDVRGHRVHRRDARRHGGLRRRRGGHRQPRPGRGRGRWSTARPGRSPRSTTPATRPSTTRCARSPSGVDAVLIADAAHAIGSTLPRPAGRHARRPDHVLVLPDQEPDHGRGRRGRLDPTPTCSSGPARSAPSGWSATPTGCAIPTRAAGTRRCTSSG